jgi:hypothetical protein
LTEVVGAVGDFSDCVSEDKPLNIPPPKTLREAKLSPWWPQYSKACNAEITGLEENKTWDLVPISTVPKGKNILRGKFVFDDKRGEDGKVARFKARFVAMGFTQVEGVDYGETFAAVVISKSFRTMLAILNEDPTHEMEHWDVKMAFTMAPVEEELYMHQPEGFEKLSGLEILVCRLKKSLYGLKQSARNWQLLLKKILCEINFIPFYSDPCVFFAKIGNAWCIVSTHVDDIFVLFNEEGEKIRDQLFSTFLKYVDIGNLGTISWALKTHIQRDREKGILKISQELFTKEFLGGCEGFDGVSNFASVPTVTSGNDLAMTPSEEWGGVVKNFQSDIGSFWWLAQISRPDIYYAVHRASKWATKPSKKLANWILQIKKYLAATSHLGIVFQRAGGTKPILSGFVDAAHGAEGGESRTGYFFLFLGNLVSWTSENPKRVMTSSTEVECRGLCQFSKENVWQRQFHEELGLFPVDKPTIAWEDNSASIHLSTNPGVLHKRSKHFGLEWALFKQCVEFKEILPVFVKTEDQPADMLTKPLGAKKFLRFREMVMGEEKLQKHFDVGNVSLMSTVTTLKMTVKDGPRGGN